MFLLEWQNQAHRNMQVWSMSEAIVLFPWYIPSYDHTYNINNINTNISFSLNAHLYIWGLLVPP